MTHRLKVSGSSIPELRAFLEEFEVDLGCRPAAVLREGRYETVVLSEDSEMPRIMAWRFGGITVEDLGALPSADTRLSLFKAGNRFINAVPSGFGIKE
ncbi:hypothetical protein [Ruegeria sp. HKCCD8929]|uniref:hypothetical protein n=1 Tax=Ruegeria sp. HKCCD8929 TaxID=2683006 RepID=UPI001488CA8D|nr:hypothetical protein [Ruegeria sp. HKCCD8929]